VGVSAGARTSRHRALGSTRKKATNEFLACAARRQIRNLQHRFLRQKPNGREKTDFPLQWTTRLQIPKASKPKKRAEFCIATPGSFPAGNMRNIPTGLDPSSEARTIRHAAREKESVIAFLYFFQWTFRKSEAGSAQ